ncbi:MAG: chemotaxis protein CheX [Desulfobacterota bacterium]|nr:chemotaxis protein CheX [Thermodesulfobacteriota bacterium]
MDNRIVQPFIDATVKVLGTMAFVTPQVIDITTWDNDRAVGEVVGIIGLSNADEKIRGFMSVGFSEASIVQIVSNMLGEEFPGICEEVREAVGEIANMISGQVRQSLSSQGIKLQASLPSVVSGKDLMMDGSMKRPSIMIQFSVEKGPFEVGICIDGIE